MWRQPIHAALAALPAGFSATTKLPAAARAECERLHRVCREDVMSSDRFSADWLDGVQRQLEVLLLRHLRGLGKQLTPARTVRSALDWMRQHLDSREPIARLCDYLGISQPTLHRLFRAQAGRSALQAFRARLAAELPELGQLLLEASRQYNASGAGYQADFATVTGILGQIAGIDGRPTLSAAERQVQLLDDLRKELTGDNKELIIQVKELRAQIAQLTEHAAAGVRVQQAGFQQTIAIGQQQAASSAELAGAARLAKAS
jgi:AraC-like DNA-binding protein